MNHEMIIHSDGGARGNPGPGACAFVAESEGRTLHKSSNFLGKCTNNFAEYQGVLLALGWLKENRDVLNGVSYITFYLDSELIVKQILGIYKVKDEKLKKLYSEVYAKMKNLPIKIFYRNIPRAKNKIADLLVNEELDSQK